MKYFFPHEFNSRNDRKLKLVLCRFGLAGIGLFWCIVEMLYSENGRLPLYDIDLISRELNVSEKDITDLLNLKISDEETLFSSDNKYFWNETVLKKLEIINKKTQAAKNSAAKRWAMQTQCDSNTTAQKEVKELEECLHFGTFQHVNLTKIEYERLFKRFGKEIFNEAIYLLDRWLHKGRGNAKKYIGKNHYAHFRADRWAINEAKKALGIDDKEEQPHKPNWSV